MKLIRQPGLGMVTDSGRFAGAPIIFLCPSATKLMHFALTFYTKSLVIQKKTESKNANLSFLLSRNFVTHLNERIGLV